MNKYRLTEETKVVAGVTVHRIQALKSFGDVTEGDLGGWIESKDNLSQEGLCWVFGDAEVFGYAWVFGYAEVFEDVRVFGNAKVSGYAKVSEYAKVCEDAKVYGDAEVYGEALVCGDAKADTELTEESETFTTLDTETQPEYERHTLSKLLLDIGDLDCKFPEEMICRDITSCKMRIRLLEGGS